MEDKYMTKVIISIVSVLLILFPFSSTLLGTYQQLTFPGVQEITNDIIDAVKSNDVAAIEEMLSEETKQNMEDPQKEISEFLQTIDGEIINAKYHSGSGEEDRSGAGYVYSFRGWIIEFETTENIYWVWVSWVRADTKSPEHCGLVGISISDTSYNRLAEIS